MNLKLLSTEGIVRLLDSCEHEADKLAAAKRPISTEILKTARACKSELDQR